MKKIVALVLSLVMVLGLATTAFAAADTYDLYLADDEMAAAMALGVVKAAAAGMDVKDSVTIDDVAAKVNKDGSGNVAYVKVGAQYGVKTTTPTVKSYAVCEADKTAVLYYVDIITTATAPEYFSYSMAVTAFNNFGMKCGQVDNVNNTIDASKDYFLYPVDGKVYLAGDATGTTASNFLLDGAVVSGATGYAVIDHAFTANNFKYDAATKTNVPTSAICTKCLATTSAIYKIGKAPANSTVKPLHVGLVEPVGKGHGKGIHGKTDAQQDTVKKEGKA